MSLFEKHSHPFGNIFEIPSGAIFCGYGGVTMDELHKYYPHCQFCKIQQVHGTDVIKATINEICQGDAHWTSQSGWGLVIRTADCLPIFGMSEPAAQQKFALAIHAGWRGIAGNVIGKALEVIPSSAVKGLRFFIGPHIQQSSFQVRSDVASELNSAFKKAIALAGEFRPSQYSGRVPVQKESGNDSYLVNLSLIARAQIEAYGVPPHYIEISNDDTFSDARYASFRRNKTDQRQLSFVYLR